jgi:hypothetical protein
MTTTSTPTIRTKEEEELQALLLLVKYGSARKAAAVIYCDRRTVHNRARNWVKRQGLNPANSPRGENLTEE